MEYILTAHFWSCALTYTYTLLTAYLFYILQLFLFHFFFYYFALCVTHHFFCLSLHVHPLASEGRFYPRDVTPGFCSNGSTLSRTDGAATEDDDDDDDWREQEASRTHSVKFTDPQEKDNREVRNTLSSTLSYAVRVYNAVKDWVMKRCCENSTGSLSRSNSYYMLNTMRELDEIYNTRTEYAND